MKKTKIFLLIILAVVGYFVVRYSNSVKYIKYYENEALPLLVEKNKDEYLNKFYTFTSVETYLKDSIYEAESKDDSLPFNFSIHSARQTKVSEQILVFYFDDRSSINDSKINYKEFANDPNNYKLDHMIIKLSISFDGVDKQLEYGFNTDITKRSPAGLIIIKDNEFNFKVEDSKGKYIDKSSTMINSISLSIEDHTKSNDVKTTKIASFATTELMNKASEELIKDENGVYVSNSFNGSIDNYNLIDMYDNPSNVINPNLKEIDIYSKYTYRVLAIYGGIALVLILTIFVFVPAIKNKKPKLSKNLSNDKEIVEVMQKHDEDLVEFEETITNSEFNNDEEVMEEPIVIEEVSKDEKVISHIPSSLLYEEDGTRINLHRYTLVVLKEIAKDLGLTGYSSLRKDDLIRLINKTIRETN